MRQRRAQYPKSDITAADIQLNLLSKNRLSNRYP